MSGFSLDLSRFAAKTKAQADRVMRKVGLEVLTGVVLMTPVRTGTARRNWQLTIGRPAAGTRDHQVPGTAAVEAIKDATSAVAGAKIEDVVFVTNNLPYIGALERGSSKAQAPNGMVRETLRRFSSIVEGSV